MVLASFLRLQPLLEGQFVAITRDAPVCYETGGNRIQHRVKLREHGRDISLGVEDVLDNEIAPLIELPLLDRCRKYHLPTSLCQCATYYCSVTMHLKDRDA